MEGVSRVWLALGSLVALSLGPSSAACAATSTTWASFFFAAGVVPFMLGLTNKGNVNSSGQLANWTDPDVGGLIVIGLAVLVVFLFAESRAKEPIIPLDLFKERDYAVSMAAVFAFGIAMFAAVIFMPRFYQTVRGISATA